MLSSLEACREKPEVALQNKEQETASIRSITDKLKLLVVPVLYFQGQIAGLANKLAHSNNLWNF